MQNYKRQLARWIGCCAVGSVLSALGQGQVSVRAPAKLAGLQQVAVGPPLLCNHRLVVPSYFIILP